MSVTHIKTGMNMDFYNEENNEYERQTEIQNNLIRLIKVLDECLENIDSFYCYTLKKQMLAGSNQN